MTKTGKRYPAEVKRRAIEEVIQVASIQKGCQMTGLSRRIFYNHQVLSVQKNKQKRVQGDLELRDKIEKIHSEFLFLIR